MKVYERIRNSKKKMIYIDFKGKNMSKFVIEYLNNNKLMSTYDSWQRNVFMRGKEEEVKYIYAESKRLEWFYDTGNNVQQSIAKRRDNVDIEFINVDDIIKENTGKKKKLRI